MEKQYLNEEKYQKTNGKVKLAALMILICGILIGGGLITLGFIKQDEARQQAETLQSTTNARLSEIGNEMSSLEAEVSEKEAECDALDMNDSDWFEKDSKCNREVSAIESKIDDLTTESFKLEHQTAEEPFVAPFYMFGAFVIIASAMISLAIWIFTKRRSIRAYAAQQTMPVNKEIIDEYSGTVADVAGKIAKSVKQSPKADE